MISTTVWKEKILVNNARKPQLPLRAPAPCFSPGSRLRTPKLQIVPASTNPYQSSSFSRLTSMASTHSSGQPIFPEDFLKGIALSVYQNSGDKTSNWTEFIKKSRYLGQRDCKAAFAKAADFWDMYETDIKMIKELGGTAFRFSFEWARFEPDHPGGLDEEACKRYEQILDCCEANGLEPMATLHHFVHPVWFEAAGGFTKEENIPYFVNYATAVFQRFGHRIKLWATFNEPTCFSFVGYIVGLWAPGNFMRLERAGIVLGTLLKAHCAAYRALKKLPGGQTACIGMVHQHIKFYPRHNLPWVRAMCKWMTFWFGTYTVLNFFQTGVFEWDTPWGCGGPRAMFVDEGVAAGEKVTDWWGINYYSRPCMNWRLQMGPSAANEPCSDTNFRLYPQGLYDSIKDASVLKVPIYITETGLADKQDKYRGWYIKQSYNMVLKCIADGFDVRGVFWWTLMDNIEWHEGFHIKFGLYRWDPEYAELYKDNHNRPPGGLQLREGAKALPEFYKAWPNTLAAMHKYAAQHAGTGAIATSAVPAKITLAPGIATQPASTVAALHADDTGLDLEATRKKSSTRITIVAASNEGQGGITSVPIDVAMPDEVEVDVEQVALVTPDRQSHQSA